MSKKTTNTRPNRREPVREPGPIHEPRENPNINDPRDRFPEVELDVPQRVKSMGSPDAPEFNPHNIAQDLERQQRIGGAAVALMQQDQQRQSADIPTGDDPKWVYFVRCTHRACRGPGMWIHVVPSGTLRPHDWEASYKPRTALWPGKDVICQACYQTRGVSQRLPLFHQDGLPFINQRHVAKIPRSKFDEIVGNVDISQREAATV